MNAARRVHPSAAAAICAVALSAASGANRADRLGDCGLLSLRQLLRIEGLPIPTARIETAIRRRTSSAVSMRDLREVAAELGLSLRGVHLSRSKRSPAAPALVYMNWQPSGHFIVIRPVGHSGTLVQILDPNRAPYVIEADQLHTLPGWTGIALVPDRPNWPLRIAAISTLLAGLALLARTQPSRRLKKTRAPAAAPPQPI